MEYVIDLNEFDISNDNTNAKETTQGINNAIVYAKNHGYSKVVLPKGHYSIDTSIKNSIVLTDGVKKWTHHRQGIIMESDMELVMNEVVLEMIPTDDPYYSILTISNCNNSKITGGIILGDRKTHYFGRRINQNNDELESGSYDLNTGLPINNDNMVRTKEFIDNFNGEVLPKEFFLMPLEKTTKNTVDGGVRYIYCYDINNKYLGLTTGGNGFISKAILLPNTSKIKVAFKDEKRLDAIFYITKQLIYPSHEFGSGITVTASKNIEINSVTVKDTVGDCLLTMAPPLNVTVDDLKVINCTFENSRRQGISLVATGEEYLIKGCKIGRVNGIDPQSGIDIEHYNYLKNTVIEECNFYDNRKWDIINYNGNNIDIKNNKFTGGIGSTFGWNMNVENNEFIYKEIEDNPKIHKGVAISLSTNKTDSDNIYFKVNNNIINGYNNSGSIRNNKLNEFVGNKIYNSNNLKIYAPIVKNNIYEDSSVSYSTKLVTNEIFQKTVVGIENDNINVSFDKCFFEESQFRPRVETIIKNSTVINREDPFGDTSAWWSLKRKVILDNCYIKTEYNKNINFLSNYQANTIFKNCNLNLSRNIFSLNYGAIEFENCYLSFNDFNKSDNTVVFDRIGYGNENNYWSFINCQFVNSDNIKISEKSMFNCRGR